MKINELKKQIKPILTKEGVKKAGIFGSYARGEQKRGSDIDILIKIDDSFSLLDLVRIQTNLEKKTQKKVDLVEYCTIKPELKKNILNDEIRII